MMKGTDHNHQHRGWLITEAVIGLTLMVVLITVVVTGVGQYAKSRDEVQWRRAALYAAESQLVRIRAGAARDSSPPEGLVPAEIAVNTETTPGEGEWAGFDLVEVRATADLSPRRQYEEVVKGYVPRHEDVSEVKP